MTDADAHADDSLRRRLAPLQALEPSAAAINSRVDRRVADRLRHRRRRRVALGAALMLAGVAAVSAGVWALAGGQQDRSRQVTTGQPPSTPTVPPPATGPALAIDPSAGLRDGSTVKVHGRAAPGAHVTIVQCVGSTEPAECAVGGSHDTTADVRGRWDAGVTVQRWLGRPGHFVDCAARDCRIYRIGAAGPEASVPLPVIDDGEPAPTPRLSLTPAGPVLDGEPVRLTARGLPPGVAVDIGVCHRQAEPQESPPCVFSGGGTTDMHGDLVVERYVVHLAEPAAGVDCTRAPGCELAWYPQVGAPPYVRLPIDVG